jgi:flagellin-like hook-associated protein FlgL
MQINKSYPNSARSGILVFFFLTGLLFSFHAQAQSTYLPFGDKQYILLERLEIKAQKDSVLNFSKTKPFNRKYILSGIRSFENSAGLSKTDAYNLQGIYLNNIEYLTPERRLQYASKRPLAHKLFRTPANAYEVHVKDFDLVMNSVLQFTVSKEQDNNQKLFLNTRGLYVRGRIANKIGFYALLTDNQERTPVYVQQWVNAYKAVPGNGYYKAFKTTAYDYFDARGYFTFSAAKYIDIQFGYDKNFIGNGYRSLFLSDFSSNNLFLKLNTRIWRFNYQNLFMELNATEPRGPDRLLKKKYATLHHLDVNLTKSVNIGLFEGIIFGRPDHFEFGYLNPIIFYRSIEQQNGSFDNALVGIDGKANIKKAVQLYGQLVIDEFVLSEIKRNRGWWANKWGIQAGAKYIDAFGIKNLDLQVEHNRVRPFTYSHDDSVSNYTHYNQPLAHPLGANFKEFIGIARYQPAPKWMIMGKLIYYQQGRDSNSVSYGSNIFLPNTAPYRTSDFGFNIGSGWKTNVMYAAFLLSYEWKENLFFELNAVVRRLETKTPPILSQHTSLFSFGVRWNMQRRDFEF